MLFETVGISMTGGIAAGVILISVWDSTGDSGVSAAGVVLLVLIVARMIGVNWIQMKQERQLQAPNEVKI